MAGRARTSGRRGQRGQTPPAFSRRRGRTRRRGSGSRLRRPKGPRRPSPRSPGSRASRGTRGRPWVCRGSLEQNSRQRPEHGQGRAQRCGARGRRLRAPGRSPGSSASSGGDGRTQDGRSSPKQSSRRRPELGLERLRATEHGEAGEEGGPTRGGSQGTGRDDGELGGGADGGEWRRRSTAAGGDEGDGDGSTGRSGLRGLTGRTRMTTRSSYACRRGEGEAVAMVVLVGGGGGVWSCERMQGRGEERTGGE